jgi:hypothetical protein
MPSMHARFSRWIGPVPASKPSIVGWLVLAAVLAAILSVFVTHPMSVGAGLGALTLITIVAERKRTMRLRGLAQDRQGEDIGSFARSFDRRDDSQLDPWAIRAVWNALVPYTRSKGRQVPLRPTDRFEEDLGIDPDDIEDLVSQLVEQCERVPGNWKANPYNDGVTTVGALVRFISAQPLRRRAQSRVLPNER